MTTSGCGTVIKDYGFLLREDPFPQLLKTSAMAKDITAFSRASISIRRTQKATSRSPITRHVRSNDIRKSLRFRKELLSKNGFVVKKMYLRAICVAVRRDHNFSPTLRADW